MNNNFNLNTPVNNVSFGQTSIALIREFIKLGLSPSLFPVGNVDLSTQTGDLTSLQTWIQENNNKSMKSFRRGDPTFKLWHLHDSAFQVSNKQYLLTFYECDSPTSEEVNLIKNNEHVFFTSNYSADIFKEYGCNNISVIPLGFDKANFGKKNKTYLTDRITFNLLGKFEHRKRTDKTIKAWIKRFGRNGKYFLSCAVWNPFFSPEDNNRLVNAAVGGNKPFNVEFHPFLQSNALYNDLLNSGDIVLAMSGSEGWGLGEFHSVGIGKHCVGLYAHGHKEWMDANNSTLVNPNGKIPAYDGIFFKEGQPFNQGKFYDWSEDEFIAACETAIKKFESNKVNTAGLAIQEKFTYENTANLILGKMGVI